MKSIYFRNFLSTAMMVLLSFLIIGAALFFMGQHFIIDSHRENMKSNAEAVAALGLEAEIDALEAANNAFDEAFEQRTQEAAAHADLSDLDSKELLDDAARIYAEIVQTVNAYAIVQPTDEINAFIQTVNGYVVSFSEIIDGGTSGGSTGDEPTDPTDPTEPTDPDEEDGTPGEV